MPQAVEPSEGPICFLQGGRILVTYVVPKAHPELAQRSDLETSALRLNALFLNPATGGLVKRMDWPTRTVDAGAMRAPDGGFVVLTPDLLTAYSADYEAVSTLLNEAAVEGQAGDWFAYPSPAGAYLLLLYGHWVIVRTGTLRVLAAGQGPPYPTPMLDDGEIVTLPRGGPPTVGFPGQPGRPLEWPVNHYYFYGDSTPVNPHALFFFSMSAQRSLGVYSDDRNEAFVRFVSNRDWLGRIAVAADGSRFAIALNHAVGGNFALDIGASRADLKEIDVYQRGKIIALLKPRDVSQQPILGMALNADGTSLAVITADSKLKTYALPPD